MDNQLLILNRDLTLKQILVIDNIIPVEDIISPQKTTLEIEKKQNIVLGDLIVLKQENNVDYIGVVQDINTEITTKIALFPLINITDMDLIISSINGNVFEWVKSTFNINFVNTQDELLKIPFTYTDNSKDISIQYNAENGNLFDVLLSLFKKFGIYLTFSLKYSNGIIESINVTVNRTSENAEINIRYDNPIIIEEPTIEKSNAQDVNKIIFVPDSSNKTHTLPYTWYLLEDDTVTTDAEAIGRINGVVQSIAIYKDSEYDNVNGLKSKAEELLLGDVLNHQITIKVLKNNSFNFKLYTKVKFIDKNKTYDSYVTRIENFSNKYTLIKLGVLRNSLTDKVKAIERAVNSTSYSQASSGGGGGSVSSIAVIDNLNSNSSTDALSARQGNVLNTEIASVNNSVNDVKNQYLKNATVSDNSLIITKQDDTTVTFTGGIGDGNLSCLRTEVVYDMTSSDKNLGHPNGIIPSTPVVINANKYDELKVYYYSFAETVSNIGSTSNCLTINLSNSLNNICFADNTGGLLYNGSVTSTFFDIRVQYSKTNQDITLYPFYNGELQSTSMYYISKIEGVLKEPAMIYTGDELLYDITIPPSTTSYTITDLDILKDGGYYKFEIYYPHNNINPTNFFMRINGNTNGGAYVHSYFAHENGNLQSGSQLVNNSPYVGTIGGDAHIAIMNLYLSKAGEIPFWDITNIGYTNHLYYEKFYGYTVASNNITSLTFFHNSVSLGGMKIRIYRR